MRIGTGFGNNPKSTRGRVTRLGIPCLSLHTLVCVQRDGALSGTWNTPGSLLQLLPPGCHTGPGSAGPSSHRSGGAGLGTAHKQLRERPRHSWNGPSTGLLTDYATFEFSLCPFCASESQTPRKSVLEETFNIILMRGVRLVFTSIRCTRAYREEVLGPGRGDRDGL